MDLQKINAIHSKSFVWAILKNIVLPNFNSGWDVITGPANSIQLANLPGFPGYVYHDPQFTWTKTVAPTGLSFVNSKELEKYKNSLFVGDCNNGNLYRFELNSQRDGFIFNSIPLTDKVVNIGDSMDEIIFGTGFGCITDVKQGPDGLLYIVSLSDGTIYRIVPKDSTIQSGIGFSQIQYVVYGVAVSIAAISVIYIIKIRRKT